MKCSAPATTRKEKTFSWHPQWVIVLILVGLLPYILVALILTKRRRVACRSVRHTRTIGPGGFWSRFAAFSFRSSSSPEASLSPRRTATPTSTGLCSSWRLLSLFVWLIVVAVVFSTAIAVTEITDRSITLKGVGSDFAQAYEESIRGYSPRVGRRDRDDWERRDDDRLAGRRRPRGLRRPAAGNATGAARPAARRQIPAQVSAAVETTIEERRN